ncbi:hypothetical protein [Microvirga splendida]|uniref:Polysaccharide lyase n=1 Tax=Microvirga splendida TaxID=2795727 RepID=A0ABS0XVI6_9HYPH|nr:hypothetical protein [Microvirga splendida]MBJ6124037.1 hypothetical protein [Microvirga splendida]
MSKIRLTRAILTAASFNMIAATAAWADADYALHCDREFGFRTNGSLPFTGAPRPAKHPLTFTVRFTGTESTRLDSMNGRTTFKNFYLESSTSTDYGGEIKDSPQRASHTYGLEKADYGPLGVRWAYSEQWKAFTLSNAGMEFLCEKKPVEQKAERPSDPRPYDLGESNGARWTSIILSPSNIGDDGIASVRTRTDFDNKPPTHAIYMIGCHQGNRFVARTDNVPEGDDAPAIPIKRTGQPPKKHLAEYRLWGAVCESKYIDPSAPQSEEQAAKASTADKSLGLENWKVDTQRGSREYSVRNSAGDTLRMNCHSWKPKGGKPVQISFLIGGKAPPPDSSIKIKVNNRQLELGADETSSVSTECHACAANFWSLWEELRKGRTMEVSLEDGRRSTFSITGGARTLPKNHCMTSFEVY